MREYEVQQGLPLGLGAARRRQRCEVAWLQQRHLAVLRKVLAQGARLPLIMRLSSERPIRSVRGSHHALEGELAHTLAVLHYERNIMGSDLECRTAPIVGRTYTAEAGIEEASVVSPQLPASGIVGDHLAGELRWNSHLLSRKKQVERFRSEHDAVPVLANHRLPEVTHPQIPDGR